MDTNETLEVIEEVTTRKAGDENIIELSTGVVLRAKKVSPSILIEVITHAKRPKPPTYFNDKMGRRMENPDDPDYIEQVNAYKYDQAGSLVTAMIMLGTEIVSIPDGLSGPHPEVTFEIPKAKAQKSTKGNKKKTEADNEKPEQPIEKLVWPHWISEYELLGIPMNPQNEAWRYLTWIKFVAMKTEKDSETIQEVVGRLSGVRETDAKAAEEFSGRK